MSNDAVAALVDAARRSEPQPDLPQRPPTRRTRVRAVDFTRPAKFSADHERRLARLLDTFCRTVSTRLAAELRMTVELELVNTAQLTWANAHAQLSDEAVCGTVVAQPHGTRLLLAAELQLVLASIERLLGGSADELPTERKLTEIDWVVAQLFFKRLLSQLSVMFRDAAGLTLELEQLEGRLDCEQLTGVSEPTLVATMEVHHDGTTSTLTLLLPHAAFAPFAEHFTGATADDGAEPVDPAVVEAAMAGVAVAVRAEVAALDLPVEQVLAIRPGDTLRLGAAAERGVSLSVGDVPIARGVPGRIGRRRAVQVTGGGA